MKVVDSLLEVCGEPYFDSVAPEVLALLTHATEPIYRRQRMIPYMCSIVWAAVRAIRNGQARCKALQGVDLEELHVAWERFRRFPTRLGDTGRLTSAMSEINMIFMRPTIKGREWGPHMMDDFRTPSDLISCAVRDCDYLSLRWVALARQSNSGTLDPQQIASELSEPDGFIAGPQLIAVGHAPPSRSELLEIAFEWAAYLGAQIVPRVCVELAARAVGDQAIMAKIHGSIDQRWSAMEAYVRDLLHQGWLKGNVAFPGRRPLTHQAARLLFS